jgi:hypothetical protein
LKSEYDPDCKDRIELNGLIVGLDKIKEYYKLFSKRRFEIVTDSGDKVYTIPQKAIYKAKLKEIDERMDFFDNVTLLTGQIKKHRDSLHTEWCIIL